MIVLLRQKIYSKRRKEHRAAKKAWEEQEGKKIALKKYGFGNLVDADEVAKLEIQHEKNGAKTAHLGGIIDMISKKDTWKDDVDPKTIKVSKDEIARKKFRDKTYETRERTGSSYFLNDHRDSNSWSNKNLERLRKTDPEEYKKALEKHQKEIKEGIQQVEKERLSATKRRLDPEGIYAKDLKHKSRVRKLSPRAEAIRKHKSLGQKIKEDLGIGLSAEAKKRIAEKNEAEDKIIMHRLKKGAKEKGTTLNESLGSFFTPANRAQATTLSGNKFGLVTAHKGNELAHELGHEHFHVDRDAGKIGKAAHKLYLGTKNHANLTIASGAAAGVASGINKARKEAKGEKESTANKLSPALTSLAVSAPMLVAEAAASKHGMKLIKNAGATRRYQKAARKDMIKAWGTYAGVPAISTGLGYLTKNAAYGIESGRLRKNKKTDKNAKHHTKKD